ncbi:unnamed protein product [Haemonchus placei]|uniref:SKA2 domain-containing protein n=1 Tax=Haemonchus placei TaxID=6290 RepID=A0A0N4W5W3_HAEPC|nr:unnamed protein product [Haemonchus placei]
MDTITKRFDQVEQNTKGAASASSFEEQSAIQQNQWREFQMQSKEVPATIDALNILQLQEDISELKAILMDLNFRNVVEKGP